MPHPLSEFVGKWKGDPDELDIPANVTEYDLNLCSQCDQKFLMLEKWEICHQCLLKRDAFHYQRGLKDAKAWISVKDKLPEFHINILVTDNEKFQWIAQYYEHLDVNENDYFINQEGIILSNITHWQLLPESPEELK
jgi:hypothetical protein